MFPQSTTTMQMCPKGDLVLEEWPGAVRSNPGEAMVEPGGLPDGPDGGATEVLCDLAERRTVPVFVEPYTFLETLYTEMKSYHEKHSPKWEKLIAAPERAALARAIGEDEIIQTGNGEKCEEV